MHCGHPQLQNALLPTECPANATELNADELFLLPEKLEGVNRGRVSKHTTAINRRFFIVSFLRRSYHRAKCCPVSAIVTAALPEFIDLRASKSSDSRKITSRYAVCEPVSEGNE